MAEHGMYSRNPEPWTQHRGFAVLGFGASLDTIDRTQGNQALPMFARIRRISLGETAKVSSNFLSCMFSVTGRANLYEALVLDRVAWLTLKSLRIGAQRTRSSPFFQALASRAPVYRWPVRFHARGQSSRWFMLSGQKLPRSRNQCRWQMQQLPQRTWTQRVPLRITWTCVLCPGCGI